MISGKVGHDNRVSSQLSRLHSEVRWLRESMDTSRAIINYYKKANNLLLAHGTELIDDKRKLMIENNQLRESLAWAMSNVTFCDPNGPPFPNRICYHCGGPISFAAPPGSNQAHLIKPIEAHAAFCKYARAKELLEKK